MIGRMAGAIVGVTLLCGPTGLTAQTRFSLEDAIREALVRNPAISRATAGAATAAASFWADWGAFLPTVRASGSLSQTDFTNITFVDPEGSSQIIDPPNEDSRKSSSAGLFFNLPILNLNRISDVNAGSARKNAAAVRLTGTERLVVRDVKRAYFEALKQQRLGQVAEDQLAGRQQDLDITERRYNIAAASRSDLLGAEIDVQDAELRLLDARQAFANAIRALQVQLATTVTDVIPAEVELVDVETLPDAAVLDTDDLVTTAVATYPVLQALQFDETAASNEVWSAKSRYLPTIDLNFALGRSKELGEDESLFDFSPANTSAALTISGSWELFSGFNRKRQTAQARLALEQTRADVTEERLRLEKDVRDLVAEILRRAARLEILVRSEALSAERLELARQQYRLGSITYFNLQQAIDRLSATEQELFTERYDYLITWANLGEKVGER